MIVMNAGRAEQIGTPAEVYGRPASTFVASFIGSPPMNLIEGTLGADGRSLGLDGGSAIALPAAFASLAGRRVQLGIRPEHLAPAADGFALGVELVEALGADMLIHGKVGPADVIARLPDGTHPAFGATLRLGFPAERVHWFDPATARRIEP
jgi:sn-glycerol 3-phosphate transport system ATP-binding protein